MNNPVQKNTNLFVLNVLLYLLLVLFMVVFSNLVKARFKDSSQRKYRVTVYKSGENTEKTNCITLSVMALPDCQYSASGNNSAAVFKNGEVTLKY